MKKILIAGCGGMLGDAFYKIYKDKYNLLCTDIDLNSDWLEYLDFRDFNEYKRIIKKFMPDYIYHIGAHTSLEYCEENKEEAYLTNYIAVENAVILANEFSIPLIFISTAGIFDGKQDLYDDWSKPNPISYYAKTKYFAEDYIQKNCNKYFIFRAGWMMGGGTKKDKKFIYKIIKQINEGTKVLNIVNDKSGTPTYTKDFVNNVELVVNSKFYGLYNLVCEGETSRMEVAKEILKLLKYTNEIKVKEVNSEFFSKEYFAQRPRSEKLINYKLKLRNLNIMRNWKDCLSEYINESFSEFIN